MLCKLEHNASIIVKVKTDLIDLWPIILDCFIRIYQLPSICSFPLPTLAYIFKTSKPAQVAKSHSTLYVNKHIIKFIFRLKLEG